MHETAGAKGIQEIDWISIDKVKVSSKKLDVLLSSRGQAIKLNISYLRYNKLLYQQSQRNLLEISKALNTAMTRSLIQGSSE